MNSATHFQSRSRAAATKILTLLTIVAFANIAFAGDSKTTYQSLPNSNIRDYRASAYVTEGNTTYQALPNSNIRDYRAPTFVTKGNTTYQTLPGSNIRDYSAPTDVIGKVKR